MDRASSLSRNLGAFLLSCLLVLVLGYLYVTSFSVGARTIVVVHGVALFFLGCALYIRDLRSFLVFAMIICIPLELGYHLTFHPLQETESSLFSAGIVLDSVDVLLFLLYVHWAFSVSLSKKPVGMSIGRGVGAIFLIWIAYCFFSSFLTATRWQYSFYEALWLFKGFLVFFYLINNTSTMKDFRVLLYGLFAATMAHALWAIMQFITRLNYTIHGVPVLHYTGPEGFRSVGFFGSPDAASALMAVVCPIGVVYYFKEENSGKKFLIFVSIFIVLAAIMCTKVRAAWSAVLISFLTIAIIGYLRGQVSAKRVLAAFLIGAVFLVSTGPLIVHRFAVGTYGELRLPLMYTAMNMFQDHWLLGVGVNNYAFLLEQYVPRIYLDAWLYTVHNEYALRLAETGIVGAFLYYTLNILVMAKLFRATRSLDPLIFSVSLGLFAFLVGSIFHRFFSFYHFQPLYMLLSVVFAVTVIIPNLEKQRPADA